MEQAYNLQSLSDSRRQGVYLGALQKLAQAPVSGKELLHVKIATERSMGRYSHRELTSHPSASQR